MASYGDLQFVTTNLNTAVKGLEWPVRVSNTGGMFSRNFNESSVKSGLIQLLLTQQGERPMRPTYGTQLRHSVFAPLDSDTRTVLENTIKEAIAIYEPRVIIRSFEVAQDDANSSIDISLVFSMKDNVFSTDGIYLTIDAKGAQING